MRLAVLDSASGPVQLDCAMVISAGVDYWQISTRSLSLCSLQENHCLLFFATAEVSLKAVFLQG